MAVENRGKVTVLVVEDQPELLFMTRRLLEHEGYAVVAAENGRVAIDTLRNRPVDIMVLDMVLEDSFDGLDCYREAAALRPGQKAIIVSGGEPGPRVAEVQRLGAGRFVRKPFLFPTLLRALREELEGA
jgi:two-component system, cell cycle sensor histidine kinase and response regulator CckA